MNETNLQPNSYKVTIPGITDVQNTTLTDILSNINSNFSILANHDFVKGNNGDSIIIESLSLDDKVRIINTENGSTNVTVSATKTYKDLLKECIKAHYDDNDETNVLKPIKNKLNENVTPWEFMTGSLQMIYKLQGTKKIPVSTLYYVFLDARFNRGTVDTIDDSIEDASCIVVYEAQEQGEGTFKILENAFPTMYYEKGYGLCWKVNGNETGLPVRGLPGRDGLDTEMFIVKSNSMVSETINHVYQVEVSDVFYGDNGYETVEDFFRNVNVIENKSYSAVIILTEIGDTEKANNRVYFGSVSKILDTVSNKYVMIATFNPDNSINTEIQRNTMMTLLKNINITDDTKLPGIVLPIDNPETTTTGVNKAHLLSTTSITNNENDNNLKTDIVFTPISDVNHIEVNDTNKLNVDKYLYLKVNKDLVKDLCNTANNIETIYSYSEINSFLERYNYILKYKLETRISDYSTDAYFCYNTVFNNISINTADAMIFNFPNKNNICFYKEDKNENLLIEGNILTADEYNIYAYLPETISAYINDKNAENPTNKPGIYYWGLCTIKDSFDPVELSNCVGENGSYYIHNDDKKIPCLFKTIFTNTFTPILTSDIIWFNGISNNIVNIKNSNGDMVPTTMFRGLTNLYGWNYNSNLFSLYKYIPIYNNDFAISEDTAFNINYNVNITGDNDSSYKSLTVSGGINSNDIHTNILSADEIKNIYTKDDIISEAGVKVGVSNIITGDNITDEDYTIVIKNGLVDTPALKTSNIDVENITADSINADKLSTGSYLTITDKKSKSIIGEGTIVEGKLNAINLNEINLHTDSYLNIDKEKVKNTPSIIASVAKQQPVINNEISVNSSNSIIVSNTSMDSQELYAKGIIKNYYDGSRAQAVDENGFEQISNMSFDDVRNFNIQRLSMNKSTSNISSKTFEHSLTEPAYLKDEVKLNDGSNNTIKKYVNDGYRKVFAYAYYGERENINVDGSILGNLPYNFAQIKKYSTESTDHWKALRGCLERNSIYTTIMKNTSTDSTYTLSPYKPITFKFNNAIHNVIFGINAENEYGSMPYLNNSKITLRLLCCITTAGNDYSLDSGFSNNIFECGKQEIIISSTTSIYGGYVASTKPTKLKTSDNFNFINMPLGEYATGKQSLPWLSKDNFNGYTAYYEDYNSIVNISGDAWGTSDENYRYSSLYFTLKDFIIDTSSDAYNYIKTAFNLKKVIRFYLVPDCYLSVSSSKGTWGRKKNHEEVYLTLPVPVSYSANASSVRHDIAYFDRNGGNRTYYGTFDSNAYENAKINYSVVSSSTTGQAANNENIKSSIIVDNGIVFRDNNCTFGLGYSNSILDYTKDHSYNDISNNEYQAIKDATNQKIIGWNHPLLKGTDNKPASQPVLFYHEHIPEMYKTEGNLVKPSDSSLNVDSTLLGYARRTQIIPLKDIFEAIKHIRETEGTWTKFGL